MITRFHKITILLIFLALFLLLSWGLRNLLLFPFQTVARQNPQIQSTKIILIKKGTSPYEVVQSLKKSNLIENNDLFFFLGKILRKWPKIKAGEYEISSQMTPLEIFSVLTSGKSIHYPITIQEGDNFFQVAAKIHAKGLASDQQFISLCRDPKFITNLAFFGSPPPPTLEGYLFPDTYHFTKNMSEKDMIQIFLKKFESVWKPEWDLRAQQLAMTKHEIVTLASIIEKETGAPEERPLISSIFHNRLNKGMRLQSDPTTIYGIWETFNGNLTRSDLNQKTHYNTYRMSGLPLGPISNPGEESIQAALFPQESPYLYFVSKNDGTHVFSETFSAHQKAVSIWQQNPKNRQGKSWKDLRHKR